MARRRQKRKQRRRFTGAVPSHKTATETLIADANAAMRAGHFKQALGAYKELIKRNRQPAWLEGLEKAYAGRALELAKKGMIREAIIIWEQRAETCGKPLIDGNYLLWLLRSGRFEQAVRLFVDDITQLENAKRVTVREHLAAIALSGHKEILAQLPADDAVVLHHAAAEETLYAYCSHDDAALATALKSIPYRSPYRVFGQIIKALGMLENEPKEAARQLGRIPETSAFAALSYAARTALLPSRDLLDEFPQLDANSRAFVTECKGWSREPLGFIQDAARKGKSPNAKALLDLLVRHRGLFSQDFARDAGLKLIIHYPQGMRVFTKAFGTLSFFDASRLRALTAELKPDLFGADEAWRDALEELTENPERKGNQLRGALILRHLVELHTKFEPAVMVERQAIEDLEESLSLDPEDRDTWIRLTTSYRERGDLRSARRSLDEALARFPEDPDVLLAAVETAIAGDAYKKAARYAKSLLALDPINPKVKSILLESHLAHARKQVLKGKVDLAYKELDAAASWVRSTADRGKISLMRGMLGHADEDPELRCERLREGVLYMGDGLVGRLHLLLEADRLKQQPDKILKQAKLPSIVELTTRAEILKLVQAVNRLQGEDATRATLIMPRFTEPLKRAVNQAYSQSEMELVCEVLHRTRQFKLLHTYANQALKRWRDCPVFVYQLLYARCKGDHFVLSDNEIDRLYRSIERAHEAGDMRTAHRVREWLEPPLPTSIGPIGPLGPEPRPGDFEAILDEIGVDSFMDMLDAFGAPEELAEVRELLDEDQIRKFIQLLISGKDPKPFLNQVLGDYDPTPPPPPKVPKKRKQSVKQKPSSHVPQQRDLFE